MENIEYPIRNDQDEKSEESQKKYNEIWRENNRRRIKEIMDSFERMIDRKKVN